MRNKRDELVHQKRKKLKPNLKRYWQLYLLLIPAVIYIAIFNYAPLSGLVIAFKNYKPARGIWGSDWVGFEHFVRFFRSGMFKSAVPNTLILSLYTLLAGLPIPIIVALCIHYIPSLKYKKLVQNITYAPHFISIVVLVNMITIFFGSSDGFVNSIIKSLGGERILFLADGDIFRHLYVWSGIWQGMGWNSIIYIATLTGVDSALHESAVIDGANIWQRIRYIDLPALVPTIIIILIMNSGNIMSVGFEKALLMQNPMNLSASELISTFVYKTGLQSVQYDYGTAVGLFNTVVNLILLVTVNTIASKVKDTSIW